MQRFHIPHIDYHHLIKNKLQEIYLHVILEHFALSMIGVIFPIFLLQKGYSVGSVFFFFIVFYTALPVSFFIATKIAYITGLKHLIIYRTPLYLVFLFTAQLLDKSTIGLIVCGIIGGISAGFYWAGINALFAACSDSKKRGAETGKLHALPNLFKIIGPALGGVIAATLGFTRLFIIASIVLFLGVLPLLQSSDIRMHKPEKKSRKIKDAWLGWKMTLKLSADSFQHMATVVIWPLMVFFTIGSIESVGIAGSIISLGTFILTLYIGKLADRKGYKKLMRIGAIPLSIALLMLLFASTGLEVYIISMLLGITSILVLIPFNTEIYELANKSEDIASFLLKREAVLGVARIVFLVFGMLTMGLMANRFAPGVITAAVSVLGFLI